MLLFTADGEKTFDRHPLNMDRRHKVTIKRYMMVISTKGIVKGVRSELIAVPKGR